MYLNLYLYRWTSAEYKCWLQNLVAWKIKSSQREEKVCLNFLELSLTFANTSWFLGEERRSRNAKRRKLEDAERQQNGQRHDNSNPSIPPVTSSYPPPRNAYRGPPLPTPAAAAQQTRAANLSAAAALRAELMKGFEDAGNPDLRVPEEKQTERGVKRKASEFEEDEEEEEDDSLVPDGPDNAEDLDLEAKAKAILQRVAADKKKAEDAAREREPDDAVRYVIWKTLYQKVYNNDIHVLPISVCGRAAGKNAIIVSSLDWN